MSTPLPAIYFDECADQRAIPYLRSRGIAIETVPTQETLSFDDKPQLTYAADRGWILLTTNRRHFYALHQMWQSTGRSHTGIVLVPQDDAVPERFVIRCALMIAWARAEPDGTTNRLFRWTDIQDEMQRGRVPGEFTAREVQIALGIF